MKIVSIKRLALICMVVAFPLMFASGIVKYTLPPDTIMLYLSNQFSWIGEIIEGFAISSFSFGFGSYLTYREMMKSIQREGDETNGV